MIRPALPHQKGPSSTQPAFLEALHQHTVHGRDAVIAFWRSRTDEERQVAIAYLKHYIAAAEREQKEIRVAFRTKFWARRPDTPEGNSGVDELEVIAEGPLEDDKKEALRSVTGRE
ncbi:hypothetical protein ACO1O0_000384 [Amphichorda felina]